MSAAIAARCETLATLDVRWLCRFVAALMTSDGPIIQPTRQPVIAYVLATPLSTIVVSTSSGTTRRIGVKTASSYVRCS